MTINNYYEVRKLIIYGSQKELEKTINPYTSKAFFKTKNIFNEDLMSYDDYFNLEIKNLLLCKNNESHINSKKNKNLIFFVAEPETIQGSLYIPFDVVLSHETIEDKKDYNGLGCVSVFYNDKIVFNDNFIKVFAKGSFSYFAKPNDEIDKNWREDVEELEEEIKKLKERAENYPKLHKNFTRVIELYKEKIKQGYKYKVCRYRCQFVKADYIILYNCVDHYEKSKEYIKLEKLTQQLKAYCDKWDINDTAELLKDYKLTKIRK